MQGGFRNKFPLKFVQGSKKISNPIVHSNRKSETLLRVTWVNEDMIHSDLNDTGIEQHNYL